MIWADYAILVVIAVSAVIGFFRGFTREAIGLATWLIAFYIAFRFAEPAGELLSQWISVRSVRLAVGFGVIFLVALILGAVVNHLVARLVDSTGFSGTDRGLGAVFGVLRGVALLVFLVLLAGLTPVPEDAWWKQSTFIPHLEQGAAWVRGFLPEDLAEEIDFHLPADAPPAAPGKP